MTSIELRLLNTCCITQKVRCWGGNNQKDIAKEQGHGRKTYKVFSLNPFYQFGGDNWNMMFKQNLRNDQPCNLLPKSPEPYQERRWQSSILHSGLTLNHAFSLGHGSIKVLPTPDNTAQQRNKGMARNHTKPLVSNISGKDWEELCITGNEMATSDCFGGVGGFLACGFCMLLLYQACVSCGTAVSPSGAASPKQFWSVQQ